MSMHSGVCSMSHRLKARLLAEVLVRDGNRCGVCRKAVVPTLWWEDGMSPTLDHIIPQAIGGPHEAWNMRIVHRACNSKKNAKCGKKEIELAMRHYRGGGVESLQAG